MKFIRTNFARILDTEEKQCELFEKPVKDSDKPEELCDGFVLIEPNEAPVFFSKEEWFGESWQFSANAKIYGAIWKIMPNGTPHLQTVLKMAADGTFKLL